MPVYSAVKVALRNTAGLCASLLGTTQNKH